MMYKWQSVTMGNIVPNLREVLRQIYESWTVYHILDVKWKYNRKGF